MLVCGEALHARPAGLLERRAGLAGMAVGKRQRGLSARTANVRAAGLAGRWTTARPRLEHALRRRAVSRAASGRTSAGSAGCGRSGAERGIRTGSRVHLLAGLERSFL